MKMNRSLIAALFMPIIGLSTTDAAPARRLENTEAMGVCTSCRYESAIEKNAKIKINGLTNNIHYAAVYSKDSKSGIWIEPREIFDPNEDPQLFAIGPVYVTARLAKNPSDEEGEAVGNLSRAGKASSVGSGFMINSCLMYTAQHVVFLNSEEKDISNRQIHFLHRNKGSNLPVLTAGKVVANGDYHGAKGNQWEDWAIVQLDESIND